MFVLRRSLKMPPRIFSGSSYWPLVVPGDEGLEADYFDCIIRNSYGLGHKLHNIRTILDIGAHAGFFSLAARRQYPSVKIDAYEPNPRILPFLRANTSSADVSIFPEAVGGEEGYVRIIDPGPSDQAQTCADDSQTSGIRQVRIETAVERIGGSVDLLKMDCEGAEWQILRPGDIWEHVRNIRMEYHLYNGRTLEEMKMMLMTLGFRIVHLRVHHGEAGIIWALHE